MTVYDVSNACATPEAFRDLIKLAADADESLVAGGFDRVGFCHVCCKEGQHIAVGYIGELCRGCNSFLVHEDPVGLVRLRRIHLDLSRSQIAEIYGVAHKTISNYENIWPSNKYLDFTKRLVIRQDTSHE